MPLANRSRDRSLTPFWNRIPAFFLYALHPLPLSFAIALGAGAYLLSTWWAYIIFYAITIKYSMAALQHTLRGELKAPSFSSDVLMEGYELPMMLFAILVLFYMVLGSVIGSMGYIPSMLFYSLGVILFPAMVICLGVSEDMLFSINPLNLLRFARIVGWPYLALFGLLFFLGIAQSTFETILLSNMRPEAIPAFWLSINTVFSIISFHMMGYAALQNSEALGLSVPEQASGLTSTAQSEDTELLQKFISEGNTAAATEELRSLIRNQPENLDLRRRLHNYSMVTNQPDIMRRNAPNLMGLAVKQDSPAVAAQVFTDCRAREQLCHPKLAEAHLPILNALCSHRQFKDAVAFAKGFHTRFPDNDQTPFIYLKLAKVFSEELQRDDLAMKLLRFTLKQFPGHELSQEIKRYLRLIANLNQPEKSADLTQ